jgi:8-oxo-dGTP pyrophosphatase MutT (NUDIX family)
MTRTGDSAEHYGIEVVHPDVFLARLLAECPNDVVAVLEAMCADARSSRAGLRDG